MHVSLISIRMCKQILFDLEHGFVHKAKDARHIRIQISFGKFTICRNYNVKASMNSYIPFSIRKKLLKCK